MYDIDLKQIRDNITIEQVYNLLEHMDIDVQYLNDETLIMETCCHNPLGCGKHKLYYYSNIERGTSPFFQCYTGCGSFDIIEFISKFFKEQFNEEKTIAEIIDFIIDNTGAFSFNNDFSSNYVSLKKEYKEPKIKKFDETFLDDFPKAIDLDWEKEGINSETQLLWNVRYNVFDNSVIIPNYDVENNLLSVRQRFLQKDTLEYRGKYAPLYYKGKLFSTPTSYYLFGLNHSINNIKKNKKVVIFEAEKSCMLSSQYFNNNISAAMQGSAFSIHHYKFLEKCGVEEIIFAFDKQFKEKNNQDEEFVDLMKKFKKINELVENIKISFIFDDGELIEYKDSPIDKGENIFINLYNNRKDFSFFEDNYGDCFKLQSNEMISWKSEYDF